MPTYDYKCKVCEQKYVEAHSFSTTSVGCPHCKSEDVFQIPSGFAARVDQSFDKALVHYEKQIAKDIDRFNKDDKFAANVTGADDPEHQTKLNKVLSDQQKKNDNSLKKMKESTEKNIVRKK